ncbi:MAG: enoyl-CoA hydratase/isomerase family protein [Thalassovita sp.]
MDKNNITVRIDRAVARVTLARPQTRNAIDMPTIVELAETYVALSKQTDVKVIVLQGSAKAFSAGGDLKFVADNLDNLPKAVHAFLDQSDLLLHTMASMPQISICVVEGVAAGAGMSLAMANDLCFATSSAKFVPAYLQLGVTPDFGGSVNLKRRIGQQAALRFLLGKDGIDAARAHTLGMVDQLFAEDTAKNDVESEIDFLASSNSVSLRETKAIMRPVAQDALQAGLDIERTHLLAAMSSDEYVNNIRAFLSGRG